MTSGQKEARVIDYMQIYYDLNKNQLGGGDYSFTQKP